MSDNVNNFYVFNNDQQILHFMANVDVFKDAPIEEDEHEKPLHEKIVVMKGNTVPKGVVSLENIYDLKNCWHKNDSKVETLGSGTRGQQGSTVV